MRKQTISKFIGHLTNVINSGLTRSAYAISKDLSASYFSSTFSSVIKNFKEGKIAIDDFNTVVDLMSQIDAEYLKFKNLNTKNFDTVASEYVHIDSNGVIPESIVTKAERQLNIPFDYPVYTTSDTSELCLDNISDEEADDAKNSIEYERDNDGKIKYYKFKVCIRDKEPLVGKLSRDEMNMIYRLYSFYGTSITQREISRYFPEYSLMDFKRILRVFNITKASAPFAPHVIEENTKEELVQMQLREKENDFLRLLEKEKVRNNEKLLKQYAAKIMELEKKLEVDHESLLSSIDFDSLVSKLPTVTTINQPGRNDIIIWLSDMHIGADVSDTSIYNNKYDEVEVNCRLSKIVSRIQELTYTQGVFNNIIVCNLGDSLDGMDRQTARRDHFLPQNMNNKEQVSTFINVMTAFFVNLKTIGVNLKYYSVGESNHGGDLEYVAQLALGEILKRLGVEVKIFDKFINHFTFNNTTYCICHGNLIFINIFYLDRKFSRYTNNCPLSEKLESE